MNNIAQFLNAKGIRPTAMRLLIFKHMTESKVAKTLNDIERAFTQVDRTTLYRTLKTFEEKNIAHQIDDGTGTAKYALCEKGCNCKLGKDLHLHFHCNKCGETICLKEFKIPLINLPEGYLAENANLVIKGVCETCNLQ
ncbi:Fur family transcriptional regulator [Spongiimicrobium sp. 3-5]|uniref:Fur family transcriptional regulator n=1 Tax=Spongiimicrobium sp. 3-5 TaxID=3332596 RepID=UPI00397F8778